MKNILRTIIKPTQVFTIIGILLVSIATIGCSSDDDNGPKTFLEKYNGTNWKYIEKDGGIQK